MMNTKCSKCHVDCNSILCFGCCNKVKLCNTVGCSNKRHLIILGGFVCIYDFCYNHIFEQSKPQQLCDHSNCFNAVVENSNCCKTHTVVQQICANPNCVNPTIHKQLLCRDCHWDIPKCPTCSSNKCGIIVIDSKLKTLQFCAPCANSRWKTKFNNHGKFPLRQVTNKHNMNMLKASA
jgi:hypothetical protein